ncbi:hypothetical protein NEDG_00996 [Nematocida displodere]|uniref:K Homology domain-containing protein n=1 Tax=Nematocida displodere TaxID=1805483 RepID=A0A177EAA4_9MICR|nr:hypothetical protein NEDG_00996 [Nematocida displodere]
MFPCLFASAKINWEDVKTFHFFLFSSSSADWQLTKALNDVERRFIALGSLSYARVGGVAAKVSLMVTKDTAQDEVLRGVQSVFPHAVKINLPPYLLSNKEGFLLSIERVSQWNGARIEVTYALSSFGVTIFGTVEQTSKTKTEIYRLVEEFLGNETRTAKSYVQAPALINSGVRVYFETKIFSNRALFSKNSANDIFPKLDQKGKVFRKLMPIDKIKLAYIMTYTKDTIEDILALNDAYIDKIVEEAGLSYLAVSSLSEKDLVEAVSELSLLFASIVSVHIQTISLHSAARVFVLEMGGFLVVIGESAEIKKILRETDLTCELQMDISASIEEFICGKKNGKINKVAKESQCTLFVRKTEPLLEIALVIQGGAKNIEFSLSMIEDELPAEYSFYLHEKHHKRIIGYGGKSIQRLMKKHGVYIKFDSCAHKGHNVVIRTPKKNKESLHRMYKEVMELAGEVPEMSLGVWTKFSLIDFYAISFGIYKLNSGSVAVFLNEPLEVFYFLVPGTRPDAIFKAKPLCTIDGSAVVPSIDPDFKGTLITTNFWKKKSGISMYMANGYDPLLFSEEALWSKKWSLSLPGTWQRALWGERRFFRM